MFGITGSIAFRGSDYKVCGVRDWSKSNFFGSEVVNAARSPPSAVEAIPGAEVVFILAIRASSGTVKGLEMTGSK
jgi:hypothetical protein